MTAQAKWSLLGVVLVLAVLVAIVPQLLSSSHSDDAGSGDEQTSTSIEVAARPDCPSESVAGVQLPCLGAESGQEADQATVVNLWAWWCEPCRDELPIFDEFAVAHPELNVVGVHADTNAANGAAMLNELDVSLPSFQDDSNLFAGTLGLPGVVPITVVVAANGQVLGTYPQTFSTVAELDAAVLEVL